MTQKSFNLYRYAVRYMYPALTWLSEDISVSGPVRSDADDEMMAWPQIFEISDILDFPHILVYELRER